MSSFSKYRNEVKYDYILNATIYINKEFHDIKSIENLIDDEDFLQIYFKEPGLGHVYVDSSIEQGFLFFRFGINSIDKKKDFTSKELKEDIIEMILSLNKNIDYFKDNKIERGDIKLHIIKDTESYDKKLVNEGKLTFVSDMTEILKLTDEGKVEYYINNGLKESFNFSKQKVNTLCESLVQQGAWLEESDNSDYNNLDSNLDQTEQTLKDEIQKVDQLQGLKDELMNKVDNLINESKEEIWVIKNNKTNRYLSNKSNNDYYWVKDIEKARKFPSYEDVFDFIERESKFGNNGADNWEEVQLNESRLFPKTLADIKNTLSKEEYKKVLANYLLSYTNWISEENIDDNCNMIEDPLNYEEKIAHEANIEDLLNCVWRITGKNYLFKESLEESNFPSTDNTKKRLCWNDLKGLNLIDNYLDEDQIKWIEENISNKYHFEDGFKNIYSLLELDDNDHFISIDEYIDNIQYMNKLDNKEGDNKNV